MYNSYMLDERAQIGRYIYTTVNGSTRAVAARYFSRFYDRKAIEEAQRLLHTPVQFKFRQYYVLAIFSHFAKFNTHQTFLLFGMVHVHVGCWAERLKDYMSSKVPGDIHVPYR